MAALLIAGASLVQLVCICENSAKECFKEVGVGVVGANSFSSHSVPCTNVVLDVKGNNFASSMGVRLQSSTWADRSYLANVVHGTLCLCAHFRAFGRVSSMMAP